MAQKQLTESLRVRDEDAAAKKLPLRLGRVTPTERREIIAASAIGKSRRTIAKEFNRSANTIQAVLRRSDGRALKADFQKTLREHIRRRLIQAAPMAVESWTRAIENVATGKGSTNHRPAMELLQAAGIIQPPSRAKKTGETTIVVEDHTKPPGDRPPGTDLAEDALTS